MNDDERARTAPFDPDALEEFLQKFEPHQRASLLESFERRPLTPPPSADAGEDDSRLDDGVQRTRDVSVLIGVSDPVLQEILERIWAPCWDYMSLEELERASPDFPGLEIARQRARARRRRDSE